MNRPDPEEYAVLILQIWIIGLLVPMVLALVAWLFK